jgi:thioesterase domain-containing protein
VAGHNGDVFCFRSLAQQLGAGQPFFGLQPPGLDGRREPLARVEDLAAYFAAQIRAIRPDGPYIIAGYCAGGTIAFELALQLLRDGATIQGLALFGSPFPTWYRILPQLRERANQLVSRVVRHSRALAAHSAAAGRSYIAERLRNLKAERAAMRSATPDPVLAWREKVGRATLLAIRQYLPRPFSGRLSLFWPSRQCRCGGDSLARWQTIASSAIETYFGPDGCDGATMLREPYAATFGGHFKLFTQGASNGKITLPEQAATGHRRLENERAGLEAAVRLTQSAQRNW